MNSPTVRLIARAVVVALTSFLVQIQGAAVTTDLLKSAIIGAVLAGLEVATPLNKTVGVKKA